MKDNPFIQKMRGLSPSVKGALFFLISIPTIIIFLVLVVVVMRLTVPSLLANDQFVLLYGAVGSLLLFAAFIIALSIAQAPAPSKE